MTNCANLVRDYDYPRYLACLYLPEKHRELAFGIYGFDAEISQLSTRISEPMAGEIRIQWWRDVISGKSAHGGHPVAQTLCDLISQYGLSAQVLESMLDAHVFDFYHDGMADKRCFEAYMGETCSFIYLLMVQAILTKNDRSDLSLIVSKACGHAGVFSGIVKHLKLLGVHEHHKYQFFSNDLSSHPRLILSEENAGLARVNDLWSADIGSFAEEHFKRARAAINQLPQDVRRIFLPVMSDHLQLEHLLEKGLELSTRPVLMSRLKIWWRLFRAARRDYI